MTNKQYEQARNALIPEAKQFADRAAGPRPRVGCNEAVLGEWRRRWDRDFHRKMDSLAREKGLTG